MPTSPGQFRSIRSFVRRTGRMTPGQERALEKFWPLYGVDVSSKPLVFDSLFGRHAPVVLEIGFGNGEALVEQAQSNPDLNYLGLDVHLPGVGHCLMLAGKEGVTNIRLIANDAIEALNDQIEDASLARINLYFPDPWPKKRHHKRRLIQTDFVQLAARKLVFGGDFFIATDWANYAEHIDEVIQQNECFKLIERLEHLGESRIERVMTKFERRGLGKGHTIWDWHLRRDSVI